MQTLMWVVPMVLGILAAALLAGAWWAWGQGETLTAALLVTCAVLVMPPPRWDPAIRLREWLGRR